MGNYFEGELTFRFKLNDDETSKMLLSYWYFISDMDRRSLNLEYDEMSEEISDWLSNHPGWFSDGLNDWRSKYGDLRCPSYVITATLIGDTFEDLSGILYTDEYDENDDAIMVPESDVTYDKLLSEITNLGGDLADSDCYPVMEMCFKVCEKYNSDETLTKLISLWSPYLFNEELGTIEDEDRTFRKTYWRGNINHSQHYNFCGDWCKQYYEDSTCVLGHCLYLYNLGRNGGDYPRIIPEN